MVENGGEREPDWEAIRAEVEKHVDVEEMFGVFAEMNEGRTVDGERLVVEHLLEEIVFAGEAQFPEESMEVKVELGVHVVAASVGFELRE